MDPLKPSDLGAAKDWDAFQPDMRGYISPQQLDLWPSCRDVEDQIRQFTSTDYMRDNDAPFLALSVAKGFPATRLAIRGETFAVPISPRDIAFLATHLGGAGAPRHTVSEVEVKILGDAGRSSISKSHVDVLRKLKVVTGDGGEETTLATLDVFKAGAHQLLTAAKDTNHFATIFVILPTFNDSADIRVYATHGAVSSDVHLPKDLSQSVSAIGVYTGVSGACIEVGTWGEVICLTYHISIVPDTEPCFVPRLEYLSGALPPLRDAFCLWNHLLNAGARAPTLMLFFLFRDVESIDDFTGEDATLLCHLAPLAKAYGFKIYISRLTHTMSTKQEVQHPYKEYLESEDDIDRSDLYMSSKPKVEYEWDELRTLGGAPVRQPALLTCATKMVKTAGDLHDELMDLDLDEDDDDVEIEDDSLYSATVIYKHIRSTSILFIAP